MASLSIPPPAGPTSTRIDWRHTEDRGSTVRSENKGRGGASRSDRGRGGRGGRRGGTPTRTGKGHASPPTEKSANAPSANSVGRLTKSAPPIASTPSHTSTTSTSTSKNSSSSVTQPPPSVDLPGKPKAGSRRTQQVANKLPSLTIEPASPTVMSYSSGPQSASTTSSKLSTRRRRSHNKPPVPTISSESLTVEELASVVKARKARSGPSSPHTKESLSKNTPPHLSAGPTVTSFSTKTNIDSLVEHVRALAMDHRPSTPGSHIDWAGDEDDSLPDLDDWGVSTSTVASAEPNTNTTTNNEKAQLQLMSPILDDSLKQLPQNFDKTTPSPSVGSGSVSPNIANRAPAPLANGVDGGDSLSVNEVPSSSVGDKQVCSPGLTEPPSQSDPHSPPTNSHHLESPLPSSEQAPSIAAPSGSTRPPLSDSTSELPARIPSVSPPPIQSGRTSANSIHAPSRTTRAPSEACGSEPEADVSTKGLSASIHAPAPKSSESESGPPERPRAVPALRNPTHGRSQTLGRQPPFSAGAKRGFSSASSTSGGVAGAKGPHHGRTQSSPVTHRRQRSRPVISKDAMTKIAKSLGPPFPKREVTATNPTTSSE